MKPKKIAVVLSGCGVYDGAEIHETVLSLLAIEKHGNTYEMFAPDMEQHHVVNHLTGDEMPEKRNVLVESARIARGNVRPLSEYQAGDFDALWFPGGFGVAKNLFTFAIEGTQATVHPVVEQAVKNTHQAGKPIGALCISPALIAKILGNVTLTIGRDEGTAKAIEEMGATHKNTSHGEVVVDKENKIVTNPCYMLDAKITDIASGAENAVKALMELLQ